MTTPTETNTEKMLRAELARIANQAPRSHEVRAALVRAEQTRRRPRSLTLAAVAAAVVLVILAVPVVLNMADEDGAAVAAPPASSAACCRALEHDATWLPDGFTERRREASPDGDFQLRQWVALDSIDPVPHAAPKIVLETHSPDEPPWSGMPDKIAEAADRFTVDGRAGSIDIASDQGAQLTWITESGGIARLKLTDVDDARATSLRVAHSVRPDPNARTGSPIGFGSLPEGIVESKVESFGDSPERSWSTLTAEEVAEPHMIAVRVELTPATAPRPGPVAQPPVYARGGYVERQIEGLGLLTVSALGSLTHDQVVAIAEGITVDPGVDRSWIGRP